MLFEFLGFAGIILIALCYIPQIIKSYRTKSVNDLSPAFLWVLLLGLIIVEVYSFYIRDAVFIVGNFLGATTTTTLLVLYYKYRNRNNSFPGGWHTGSWSTVDRPNDIKIIKIEEQPPNEEDYKLIEDEPITSEDFE